MPCILCIETSGPVCSVALGSDGEMWAERVADDSRAHATQLAPFVGEMLHEAKRRGAQVEGIALSAGPGSYTGLRIGSSMAKGLCYGLGAKFYPVSTLKALCVPALLWRDEDLEDEARLCPMVDARRMEVYAAVYDRSLREVMPAAAIVLEPDSLSSVLDEGPVYFMGDGAQKWRTMTKHPNARFLDDAPPLARHMLPLAELAAARAEAADFVRFEPHYLKNFVAKTSSRCVLTT